VADGQGDSAEEKRQLDAASAGLKDIQEKVIFGGMVGDAYARAGHAEQAQKIAAMIEPLEDANNSEQAARVDLLKGDIASLAGQHDAAIALFHEADKASSTGYTIEAVAYGYQQAGDLDHAIASYESLAGESERGLGWEPQQRWVEARYTLAEDYVARGNRQKARETLEALLKLWKDADPDLPLLKRAKAEYAKVQ
jgi:tetratricopeptide (TPR) repeat protein